MLTASYFDQPVHFRSKETIADMYENRLGTTFTPPSWQETHPIVPDVTAPPPQKPSYNVVTGQWETEGVRETERVYFLGI